MSPTQYTEHDGLYKGMDGLVHNATADRIAQYGDRRSSDPRSYAFYSDLSLWDSFRTVHPWLLFIDEDIAIGVARSTAEITAQQGAFPRWVMASHEASCMIGNSGSALVLEAIGSGFGELFDVKTIQKALQLQSTQNVPRNGRADVEHYVSAGYVSMEASDVASSLTMTNAYDDFVLAGISEYVGAVEDAASAKNRSYNYRNIWSSEKQFICPRSVNGELVCSKRGTDYAAWTSNVEGDALHWSWFVPHDPAGLIALYPSPAAYDAALEEYFAKHVTFHEKFGSAAPNPYYWAGNEHTSFNVWMFNYGPNCTRAQYWSRRATEMHFSNTPHGIPGNDDYGSMSTWVLFASLGVFPRAGTTQYMLGSPRVQSASINIRHLGGAVSTLNIVTYNNSPENVFVQKLLVNGVEHTEPFIDRSVLTALGGAKLEFFMQAAPVSGLCASA